MNESINWQQALKCCLVIGPSDCIQLNWLEVIDQAIQGGITSVQLREKKASPGDIKAMAQQAFELLPPSIPLIINDHVAIANELKCAAHIGQSDMSFQEAQGLMGPDAPIGLSIENMMQAKQFKRCGAAYFGVGPIFDTASKSNAAPAIGVERCREIIDTLTPTPCIIIGGINQSNISNTPNNKSGIAVISAITQARSPLIATQQLMDHL